MNPASEDIKDLLESESSLGLEFATNLFIGREPNSPNDCVTIFDTPGRSPLFYFSNTNKYDRPSVQIRIRDTNYNEAASLAQDIKNTIHNRARETWNGAIYTVFRCSSEPALLDWDENSRARFIINFELERTPQ